MKSAWFKKVANQTDDLMQGDLILDLRIPTLEVTDATSKSKIDVSVDLKFVTSNYIILTQSCDLSPENEKNLTQVLLVPAPRLEEFLKENDNFSTQDKVKNILKNKTV